jgi:hypothetical protein
MGAARRRAYGSSMNNDTATRTPAAAAHRLLPPEPRSFTQPRDNDRLLESQRAAAHGRAGARQDALVTAWLRALGRE